MSAQRALHLHVGVAKTGTTFLQQVLAKNRQLLREQGMLYPGPGRDHFFAAQDLLQRPFGKDGPHGGWIHPKSEGAWRDLVGKVNGWQGSALISAEMLTRMREEHIERVLGDFPDHDIHVVVTLRDLVRQLPAVWQEDIKNGKTSTLDDWFAEARSAALAAEQPERGFWAHQAADQILARWEKYLPVDRLCIVTVPPTGAGPNVLWDRFCEAVGLRVPDASLDVDRRNDSLRVVETEYLRRLNLQVKFAWEGTRHRDQVKRFLVPTVLAPREGEPIRLTDEQLAWALETSRALVSRMDGRGYRIIGSLDDLTPGTAAARGLVPSAVTDAQLAEVGVAAMVGLLDHLHEQADDATPDAEVKAQELARRLLPRRRRG